jgi:hypothetical protein
MWNLREVRAPRLVSADHWQNAIMAESGVPRSGLEINFYVNNNE